MALPNGLCVGMAGLLGFGEVCAAKPPTTSATTRPGPPAVRVDAVSESRAHNVVKLHESAPLGETLTLRVGYTKDLDAPTAYGNWHLTRAVDDVGTDLRPPPPSTEKLPATTRELVQALDNATDFTEANQAFATLEPELLKSERDGGATDFHLDLHLGLASRVARRIAAVTGDVTVYAGGESRTVTFDRPTRLLGHRLDDPSLTAAGVTVDLLPPGAPPDPDGISVVTEGPHVRLRCRGDLRAFVEPKVEIVDRDGKSAKDGFSDDVDNDRHDQTVTLSLARPLDDAMSIRLTVVVGRRAVVVPFDLRDVRLP